MTEFAGWPIRLSVPKCARNNSAEQAETMSIWHNKQATRQPGRVVGGRHAAVNRPCRVRPTTPCRYFIPHHLARKSARAPTLNSGECARVYKQVRARSAAILGRCLQAAATSCSKQASQPASPNRGDRKQPADDAAADDCACDATRAAQPGSLAY